MQIVVTDKERKALALSLVKGIMRDDCPMSVTIEPYIEAHSDPQRGKFHILVREMSRITGYTECECKELVKKHILGTKLIKIGDIAREVTCSSEYDDEGKKRDKPSYSELIEGCYELAAQAGIQL